MALTKRILLLLLAAAVLLAAAPPTDTVTLINGDQLTGALLHADGGTIAFQTALAGTLTIPWKNIRELRAAGVFAVIGKDHAVHEGTLTLSSTGLVVGSATVALSEVDTVIDAAAYHKATADRRPWQSWQGALTGGVSLVDATQSSQSLTAGLDLHRPVPGLAGLAQTSNTLFFFHGTYGSLQQAGVPTVRTSIYSTGAEQDENLSPRLFAFGTAGLDHNYSQGLQLQQAYGGGAGWILVQSPRTQWDLKADIHWTHQEFLAGPATQFVASTLAEHWQRSYGKLVWTQTLSVAPSYSNSSAFQAHGLTAWALPVWHGWAVNLALADSYLGNPQAGFQKNSLQFSTGFQFAIK